MAPSARQPRWPRKIHEFYAAGVRHLSLDLVGPYERRGEQFERFAAEVRPLIKDLMG